MDANHNIDFRELALLELKRAERYRNFLSLVVINLSDFLNSAARRKINTNSEAKGFMDEAAVRLKPQTRVTDIMSFVDNNRLVLLLPETDNKGAWSAGQRLQNIISEYMAEYLDSDFNFHVPIEVISFPGQAEEKSFVSQLNTLFMAEGGSSELLN